jgi:hypothetical protein
MLNEVIDSSKLPRANKETGTRMISCAMRLTTDPSQIIFLARLARKKKFQIDPHGFGHVRSESHNQPISLRRFVNFFV